MENSTTLFGIVAKGGILMVPIVLCSFISIALAIERYLAYKKLTVKVPQFMMKVRQPLSRGDVVGAISECSMAKGPVAAVVKAGLEKAKHGRERMREAMEAAGNAQTYLLEKNLSILATLAGITPLIGFLGTVTGMIKAFMKIQQLAGNVNADVLAGGIWEAMVTTAAGLTVGIPTMILYNYYVNRVREFVFQMETAAEEVMDIVAAPGAAAPGTGKRQPAEDDYRDDRDDERRERDEYRDYPPSDDTEPGGERRYARDDFDTDSFNPEEV